MRDGCSRWMGLQLIQQWWATETEVNIHMCTVNLILAAGEAHSFPTFSYILRHLLSNLAHGVVPIDVRPVLEKKWACSFKQSYSKTLKKINWDIHFQSIWYSHWKLNCLLDRVKYNWHILLWDMSWMINLETGGAQEGLLATSLTSVEILNAMLPQRC